MKTTEEMPNQNLILPLELEVDSLTPPRIKYQVVGNFYDKFQKDYEEK